MSCEGLFRFFYVTVTYRSIAYVRSSILAYHDHIDENQVRQHPFICSWKSSVFTGRPLKPRFSFAWDAEEFWHFAKVENVKYKELLLMSGTFESSASVLYHLDI